SRLPPPANVTIIDNVHRDRRVAALWQVSFPRSEKAGAGRGPAAPLLSKLRLSRTSRLTAQSANPSCAWPPRPMPTIGKSFWLGNRLPLLQVLSLQSFIAHGHEYHLYVYDPIENAPEGVVLCDASKILPRQSVFTYQKGFGKGSYSAFSNLFRYKLLLEHGGW